MKKFLILASAAALAACGGNDDEAVTTDDTVMQDDMTAVPAEFTAGTYEILRGDTLAATQTLNADGTYTERGPDGAELTGEWAREGERTCFDPDGDIGATCWMLDAGDGSNWTATNEAGDTVTVRPTV